MIADLDGPDLALVLALSTGKSQASAVKAAGVNCSTVARRLAEVPSRATVSTLRSAMVA